MRHALHALAATRRTYAPAPRHPQADAWRDARPLTARELGGGRRQRAGARSSSLGASSAAGSALPDDAPQPACTDFRVLARFPAAPPAAGLPFPTALLSAAPRTGRWHQIRRHLSHARHHVLGDTKHGKLRYNAPARAALGLHRLFLHAAELRIDLAAPAAAAAGLPPGAVFRCVSALTAELAAAAARLPGWEAAAGAALRARGLLREQREGNAGADEAALSDGALAPTLADATRAAADSARC